MPDTIESGASWRIAVVTSTWRSSISILAIDLDPSFSDAYVDRGIVLYRMGDLKRAFADIAQANRIDASRPNKMPPTASAP